MQCLLVSCPYFILAQSCPIVSHSYCQFSVSIISFLVKSMFYPCLRPKNYDTQIVLQPAFVTRLLKKLSFSWWYFMPAKKWVSAAIGINFILYWPKKFTFSSLSDECTIHSNLNIFKHRCTENLVFPYCLPINRSRHGEFNGFELTRPFSNSYAQPKHMVFTNLWCITITVLDYCIRCWTRDMEGIDIHIERWRVDFFCF